MMTIAAFPVMRHNKRYKGVSSLLIKQVLCFLVQFGAVLAGDWFFGFGEIYLNRCNQLIHDPGSFPLHFVI